MLTLKDMINNIKNESKALYSFVGPNGSGKTTTLEKIKKEFNGKQFDLFYINNEIMLNDELKENKSQQEFRAQLRKFLNKYLSASININKLEAFIKEKEKIEKSLNDIRKNKYNFKHLKDEFYNLFSLHDDIKKGIINIEIINDEWKFKSFSSGEGLFSLLCVLKSIISYIKNKTKEKIIIVIDEPEKFLHDSLIKKVAFFLYELYELGVTIFFSTHSSYLVNELIINFKNSNTKFNIMKVLSSNDFFDVSDYLFDNKLNTRELSIITKSLFDEYVILVEGINDYEFVNLLCINKFNDYFFNIYECNGKENVLKLCKKINKINKNVFSFFDRDYGDKEDNQKRSNNFKEEYEINKYKYFEFVDNLEEFFNNEIAKNEFSEKINIEKILSNSMIQNIIEKLNDFFLEKNND